MFLLLRAFCEQPTCLRERKNNNANKLHSSFFEVMFFWKSKNLCGFVVCIWKKRLIKSNKYFFSYLI